MTDNAVIKDPGNPDLGNQVVTFGCRLNSFESEVMRQHLARAGWRDTVVVNSCAVTAEAERQLRQAIRRLRRDNPKARIIVTGCAAQITPDAYAAMPEVDRVIGNGEKLDPAFFDQGPDGPALSVAELDHMDIQSPLLDDFSGRARAFAQVQQGCDHHCTFCIIPKGRGANRSLPLGAVVEQVRHLVARGFPEVVLSGVDLTSYGADLPGRPGLGQMVVRLLRQIPELPRLRLSSLDPAAMDEDLLAAFADQPRLMPHVHLSAQAGDTMVLKRMRRRHGRDDLIRLISRLRAARPGLTIGADLIAGFPTESDAMFENTLELVDQCGIEFVHVFPYSNRPDTPAARMPQVPVATRKERAALLRAAGQRNLDRLLDERQGHLAQALIETEGRGRDEFNVPIRTRDGDGDGTIRILRVVGREDGMLIGEAQP